MDQNLHKLVSPELPRLCGECGYSLTGLPEYGRCPECGGEYRAGELVFFGWSEIGNLSTVPPSKVAWLIGVHLAAAVIGLLAAIAVHPWLGVMVVVVTGGSLAFRLVQRLWIRQADHGPIQSRFSTGGFGTRVGYGPLGLLPWTADDFVLADAYDEDRVRILIFRKLPLEVVLLDTVVTCSADPAELGAILEGLRQQATALNTPHPPR